MWIRVLFITLLITSLAFTQAKRKQTQTKTTQPPKIHAKKLPTKTHTKQKSPSPEPQIEKSLWLLSAVWPAGYCQKKQCSSNYLKNWDHQSFVIKGLTEVDKNAKKVGESPQLNLTLFKNQDLDTLRQNLKNYFPPNFEENKSKKFSPNAWIRSWAENGQQFGIKNQNRYFEELVAVYRSLKGLQKLTNVPKNEVKSKKDLAKLLGLQENSFSVQCNKVKKTTVLSQIQICLVLKNNTFTLTKCNTKQLKTKCSFPLTISGLNQKWTRQQKWTNPTLITNYLVDPQYDIPSSFQNIVEKVAGKAAKIVQNITSTASNKTADNKKKQQKTVSTPANKTQSKVAAPKCEGKQKNKCKKTVFKSKQVSGKVQLSWILGQCYEINLRNQNKQCQWDQIMFWDQQSFVIDGLQTYPNTKPYKKQIKTLRKILGQRESTLDNLFNSTQKADLQQVWPTSIVEDENLWQQSWENDDNGIDFLITLKEILPHLFSINNQTDFSQFQREYFELTHEYYNSLKRVQKLPKSSYTLQQLAKILGVSTKSLKIQCANSKNEKTNFLTSLDVCVKLFSKDNQTISIKTSECKSKSRYEGCSLGKNKKVNLLFWRNRSNETEPYWGNKYLKVIIPVSKFGVPETDSQSESTQDAAAVSQQSQINQTNKVINESESKQESQQQEQEDSTEENKVQSNQASNNQNTDEPAVKEEKSAANPTDEQDQNDEDQKENIQAKTENGLNSKAEKIQSQQQAQNEEDDSVEQTEQVKQPEVQASAQASSELKPQEIQL